MHKVIHCGIIWDKKKLETIQMVIMRRLAEQAVVRGHSGTLSSCKERRRVQWNGLPEWLLSEKHKRATFCVRVGREMV